MKTFVTTIQLKIDPFFAKDSEEAEKIIDDYISKLAELGEQNAPELSWEECDTTPIEETECLSCAGKGEVIAYDGNGLQIELPCNDCDEE